MLVVTREVRSINHNVLCILEYYTVGPSKKPAVSAGSPLTTLGSLPAYTQ